MRPILLIIFLFIVNCKFDKVVDSHGIHYLDKKNKQLVVKSSNKNDIIKLLGHPSTESKFDNELLIYIERELTRGRLLNFGKNILIKNDVLILEVDSRGILLSKKFNNIDDMKEIKFSDDETNKLSKKNDFIYSFLSSLRQKINDPLGKRKK